MNEREAGEDMMWGGKLTFKFQGGVFSEVNQVIADGEWKMEGENVVCWHKYEEGVLGR